MSRIFLSHSSTNNAEAVAVHDWLNGEGWDDIFLDTDPAHGIAPGERWERALNQAAHRCEAVVFLVSRAWLNSGWCLKEFSLAQRLHKRLFGVLIEDVPLADLPVNLTSTWQLVQLAAGQDHIMLHVTMPVTGEEVHVTFSADGLKRLKHGLDEAGLDPKYFAWPPKHDPNRPPYRGLLPMEAEDAGIFFGRDAPIVEALDLLRALRETVPPRLLVILGASGAGKSSFLRAGLLPRLQRDDRNFLPLQVVRPQHAVIGGETGLLSALENEFAAARITMARAELRAAIQGGAAKLRPLLQTLADKAKPPNVLGTDANLGPPTLILCIDQAEELFLAEAQEEAHLFLVLLRDLLKDDPPAVITIFTIRSDNYERLQLAKELEGVHQETLSLPPMPKGSYAEVVKGPARRLEGSQRALEIEDALVDALLADIEAGGAKDALPLLAFTLERLFLEYGGSGRLTLSNYEALGRIKGSIEAAIERAFKVADADPAIPNDRVARLALLRRGLIPWLAGLDPDTGTARRRVARLSEIPAEARPLIQHLVEQRLLSTDLAKETGESTIEPAHEALLRQWGLLQGWLTEDAGLLAVLEGVKRASRDWVANNRDTPWLAHTSDRLAAAERLTARPDLAANLEPTDRQYITACREAEATAKARRRRAQTAVYVMLLGIIVGLVGWINQSYLQEQWRWYSASRPFMNTKVQPYVLTGEAEHALKPLQSFKECSKEEGRDYCPEMIVVPAGIFMMGSSQTDKNAYGKEQPQHNVTINKPFSVSEFELTFDEWDACVAYGDCARNISDSGFGRGKRPVINVVRDEAQRYVAWLARTTGKPYRLLTEAEYEYATRAGTLTAYPWGNDIGTNNSTCGGCGSQWDNTETAPVGSFAANGFGLYDMVGNAWEWVEDCYHPNYDRAPTDGSAWTTTCPDDHRGVVRGGSWAYTPATLRSAYRFSVGTDYRSVDVGFRVARTLDLAALTLTEQQIDQMKQQDLCNNVLSSDLQIAGCTTLINSGKVNSNDLASVYVNRGKAYRRKGDYDSAVADYNQAIMLDPKYVQAYLGRGAAYDGKKDYTHAVADFSQAITLDPKNADAFSARCWNEAITVQLPTVLTDCNQAVALQPGNADFLDSRGFTYLKLGQYANAVADYTAALKINPKLAYSLYGRGFAETKSGNAADGDKDIAAAKAIDANIANEFADWGVN